MIIGIDATNILQGGGVTHLVELLNHSDPAIHEFERIVIWGAEKTLNRIADRPWIARKTAPHLNKSLFHRTWWKTIHFPKELRKERCNILFVPGGSDATGFHPMVNMSQNMLPFELNETFRYGVKPITARLIALRFVQSKSFRKADGLIFLSNYAKQTISNSLNFKEDKKTTVIPHGISKRFFVEPRKQRQGFDATGPCRLIYVSILDPYKHHKELLLAIKILKQKNIPVHLDLVGPAGTELPALASLINELNDSKKMVTYVGAVPYETLHDYYSRADIGIFASSCENMPNILLEMMAAGLPIACSSKGPMPEILGDSGAYFNPESAEEMAAAIETLINSAELRERLATGAFQKARQFSWQSCANDTFSFLKTIARNYNRCAES